MKIPELTIYLIEHFDLSAPFGRTANSAAKPRQEGSCQRVLPSLPGINLEITFMGADHISTSGRRAYAWQSALVLGRLRVRATPEQPYLRRAETGTGRISSRRVTSMMK